MKLKVDPELCISCGLCINMAPAVFDWDEDEKAKVIVDEVPSRLEAEATDAQQSCPTEAIKDA
ncbi:MAG: ferredoxin [Bacillota bacterium]